MPAPSLKKMATQRLIKNIHLLDDVGDMPFDFLENVLRNVENPAQLQRLEENCPQLQGETGEIWMKMIKRDIPDWDQKPHQPRDPRDWSKVYRKMKKDNQREIQAQQDALKQQMQAIQQDRAQNKTKIFTTQVGYGARSSNFGRTSGWGVSSGAPAKTGKVALDKLKRGMFDHNRARPRSSMIPSHILAQRKRPIQAAPSPHMIRMAQNEHAEKIADARQSRPESLRSDLPVLKQPTVTHRPIPQHKPAEPPSLPAGHQFSAPKPRTPATGPAPGAKRRPEHQLFHNNSTKRRRV